MAVFLTLGMIGLIAGQLNITGLVFDFFKQMILGITFGFIIARLTITIINKIKLEYDSLYVVITLASVILLIRLFNYWRKRIYRSLCLRSCYGGR